MIRLEDSQRAVGRMAERVPRPLQVGFDPGVRATRGRQQADRKNAEVLRSVRHVVPRCFALLI